MDEESAKPRSTITGCRRPGKIAVAPTKDLLNQRDLALAYSPGVAAACEEIVADPAKARDAHRARQPGRGDHQRHRGAGPRRHRPAGRQAGDGRQGGAVQEVRRHRRLRHRDQRARPRQAGRHHRRARADLRRHQPRGHQGAGVLLRRAQAARADEDPGLPRRPARHRDHRRRGASSTACRWSARTIAQGQAGRVGRRRRGARLPRPAGRARACRARTSGSPTSPAWSTRAAPRTDGPATRRATPATTNARTLAEVDRAAPTSSSACRPAAC